MDMELVPILIFAVTSLLIIVGGVILFPIARRLGAYLEAQALERRGKASALGDSRELQQLLSNVSRSLESLETRLDQMDDRQNFLENLVETRSPDRLTEGVTLRDPQAQPPDRLRR